MESLILSMKPPEAPMERKVPSQPIPNEPSKRPSLAERSKMPGFWTGWHGKLAENEAKPPIYSPTYKPDAQS